MSTRARDTLMGALEGLRHEPTEKRVRAKRGDREVVDTTRALLVWEPRRIVPSYAVPIEDVRATLSPVSAEDSSDAELLHPGIPFAAHSTEGESLDLELTGETLHAAGFRPADPDLADHVILDYNAFDGWYEEDEPIVGHPRDPFHRVDIRRSSRHVRVERDGRLFAESSRPTLVFETNLPVRFYLPRGDVSAEAHPSARRTRCAYKGEATYLSFELSTGARADLAWTYEDPLPDASALTGLVAFFDELVDVVLDGERRERPRTQFGRGIIEEAGV
jgi:uncharacterized protein (DUF427 family)